MLSHMMLPDCVVTRLFTTQSSRKEGLVSKKVFLEKEDEENLFLHLADYCVRCICEW